MSVAVPCGIWQIYPLWKTSNQSLLHCSHGRCSDQDPPLPMGCPWCSSWSLWCWISSGVPRTLFNKNRHLVLLLYRHQILVVLWSQYSYTLLFLCRITKLFLSKQMFKWLFSLHCSELPPTEWSRTMGLALREVVGILSPHGHKWSLWLWPSTAGVLVKRGREWSNDHGQTLEWIGQGKLSAHQKWHFCVDVWLIGSDGGKRT